MLDQRQRYLRDREYRFGRDLSAYQTVECEACEGSGVQVYACCPGPCPHDGVLGDCDECQGEGIVTVKCPRCGEPLGAEDGAICALCVEETVDCAAE